ncbi:HU family DNA-binding protein [Streptomyces buecherae]|uniref:HU family DNA-binding protein n=1 Tax=Streptomyces buecherae TaxID=2763006 RepID=UPI00164DA7CA|nr:hypothetical protein [Streptomyces buecherae]QNJ39044.1 hypothetical protein H7H31_03300 [Streptomyces buecherae]
MDKSQLVSTTTGETAADGGGRRLAPEEVERVLDTVFGTMDRPGVIAGALREGETVTLGSFGSFHDQNGTAAFRPGKALTEYLHDETG